MSNRLAVSALLIVLLPFGTTAQDAGSVLGAASRAMGAENLTSITYSGSAANGNFGQSRTIAGPLAVTRITNYTRAIDLTQPASRATGQTMPPAIPGGPPPQPGTFNQNITPANAAWTQQLEIWITPWGFLKGAAANNATVRAQRMGSRSFSLVSWTPAQKAPSGQAYRVSGHINDQNLVERVETWVEHAVMGDLHVEATYSNYKDFSGIKVPTTITQTRAGLKTFEATITSAAANPVNIAELLAPPAAAGRGGVARGAPPPPPPGRGGAGAAPPTVESQKLAEGVYRITGGYIALAVEFKDHIVVLEGGQSEARGLAVIAEARRAIPNKPIRFVVNTHAHFDHSSGLAPFAAEGVTIITHQNNRDFLEKALGAPRTLLGDALAKSGRKPKVEAVADGRALSDGTRTIELHHIKNLEHSDGMLVGFLPKERILFTGDFNVPAQGQPVSPFIMTLVENIDRLKLDFETHVLVHAPTPDRPMTKADLLALVGKE
jgi:glyoxylase-like metal-dependent hydrolase (beta-lactamase superfamily II)